MRFDPIVGAALLVLAAAGQAEAQDLQPGMRTMIQRGGTEGLPLPPARPIWAEDDNLQPGMRTMIQRGGTEGVLLGSILPGIRARYADERPHAADEDPGDAGPTHGDRHRRIQGPLRVRN